MKNRYLWLTDTHLWPWDRNNLLKIIINQNPKGVFLTGDISNSAYTLIHDLDFLGPRIERPLYFVIGNHDLHFSNIENTHAEIRNLCKKYKNLIWMDEVDILQLNEDTCCIGNMGWYDGRIGDTEYLKYTIDWFLIEDFRKLSSMSDRIKKFREIAEESANKLSIKLEIALQKYKTVYLLSHVPAWKEASGNKGIFSDIFYEPYNTNLILGKKLLDIMEQYKEKQLICLFGHTHYMTTTHISHNIKCHVGHGSYSELSEEEILYI